MDFNSNLNSNRICSSHSRRSSWPMMNEFSNNKDEGNKILEGKIEEKTTGTAKEIVENLKHEIKNESEISDIKMILQCVVAMHQNGEECKCLVNNNKNNTNDNKSSESQGFSHEKQSQRHFRSKSYFPVLNVDKQFQDDVGMSNEKSESLSNHIKLDCNNDSEIDLQSCSYKVNNEQIDLETSTHTSHENSNFDLSPLELILQDQYILHELTEMRMMLERFLASGQATNFELLDIEEIYNLIGFSITDNSSNSDLRESTPHFPTGAWTFEECGVCLEMNWLYRRSCCNYCACISCLSNYYSLKVQMGIVTIECINPLCKRYVHRDEISSRLQSSEMKEIYYRLLLSNNLSPFSKTCPQCNYLFKIDETDYKKMINAKKNKPDAFKVQCSECNYHWCFKCHAPWHDGLSCKQYRKGDRLLKSWAKEKIHGQLNAQRCPKCKIFIQRTTGCDHMHCSRCKTDFCYKCGDRLRKLKFFGDHYSKLSIFGCKYRYKADQPVQRKFIRGTVFASKLLLVPLIGSVALCAGSAVVAIGIVALPFYAGLKIYRKYQDRRLIKGTHQVTPMNNGNSIIENWNPILI